eukprot:CAMPEP_0114115362 /NCGR_PEP_ID=MMETSP0043_2-20121206/3930_1 /TAXON_ID=464988 /ORGANISM="Hemiselmis andersenii, Strain CCMP644" /LENGTH=187 /DNA_ID=CAMNT_0001207623 /DNA_START=298 /DNA_END=861 /DNA_ORIENTATION=+
MPSTAFFPTLYDPCLFITAALSMSFFVGVLLSLPNLPPSDPTLMPDSVLVRALGVISDDTPSKSVEGVAVFHEGLPSFPPCIIFSSALEPPLVRCACSNTPSAHSLVSGGCSSLAHRLFFISSCAILTIASFCLVSFLLSSHLSSATSLLPPLFIPGSGGGISPPFAAAFPSSPSSPGNEEDLGIAL